jgi:hypothetical protein
MHPNLHESQRFRAIIHFVEISSLYKQNIKQNEEYLNKMALCCDCGKEESTLWKLNYLKILKVGHM